MELILTGIGMLILGIMVGFGICYYMMENTALENKDLKAKNNNLEIIIKLKDNLTKLDNKEYRQLLEQYLKLSKGKLPQSTKDLNTSINEMNKHAK